MAAESHELQIVGSSIGAYKVTALLGRGGMGAVYQAEQAPLGRVVALKVIHDHLAQDAGMVARFLREAKIACSLRNPNTVTIYDFGQSAEGRLYMAMELLEGESLTARLRRVELLEPPGAIEIAAQVCRSLAEAHAKSIVHRDLKGDNVFLTAADDGSLLVKVLDYGIAHAGAGSMPGGASPETLTRSGTLLGTPAYMAPEQARGEPVDGRADLWALGVLLYEMLTGVRPFRGDNPVVVLGKLLSEAPAPMASVGRQQRLPPGLEELVSALLSKVRDERPATAISVQARLREIGGGSGKIPVPVPVLTTAASEGAALAGSWGLPAELATPPGGPSGVSPVAQTLVVPAATPPSSPVFDPTPAPPSRPTSSPSRPAPARAAAVLEAPEDAFDHDMTPPVVARLEVDRGSRPAASSSFEVARSSRPSRPRVSRPPPAPERRGGAGVVLVAGLLVAGAAAGWFYLRGDVHFDGIFPTTERAPAPSVPAEIPSTPALPAPAPSEATFSQVALQRAEDALRGAGWVQTPLSSGSWAGSFELEGGALRLFDEGGRVTGTFEEALRSGSIQGRVRPDGVLEFAWRVDGAGAVRGQGRTGAGLLRAWTRRTERKLVGTWGYGDSRDGAVWVATPARAARAAPAKRPRR